MNISIKIFNQGEVHVGLCEAISRMERDRRHKVEVKYYGHKPISHNASLMVKDFLKEDADYLLMIDSDVVPLANPLDLVELDKDIVGMPCPQWAGEDIYWVVMDKVDEGYKQVPPEKRDGLQQYDAIGTGCILIARRVLEKVKAPFQIEWDEDGLMTKGRDFFFCDKARAIGFKVWAHWDYLCDHYKTLSLLKVIGIIQKYGNK